jgi:hypothetical protein
MSGSATVAATAPTGCTTGTTSSGRCLMASPTASTAITSSTANRLPDKA